MKPSFYLLPLSLVMTLLFSSAGLAQNNQDIFVPVQESQPQATENKKSPLNELVTLQNNLYRIVLTFNERAEAYERAIPAFEAKWLQKLEAYAMMRANSPKVSPPTAGDIPGYSTIIHEPTLCAELDNALKIYIKKNSTEVQSLVTQLVAETQNISPQQRSEMAQTIHVAMTSSGTNRKRAQEILYLCLYRYKTETGSARSYSVEKTLREWFNLQAPLVDLWLGPVD